MRSRSNPQPQSKAVRVGEEWGLGGGGGGGGGLRAYLLPLLLMLRRLQLPSQIQQLSLQGTAEDQWAAARAQRTLR